MAAIRTMIYIFDPRYTSAVRGRGRGRGRVRACRNITVARIPTECRPHGILTFIIKEGKGVFLSGPDRKTSVVRIDSHYLSPVFVFIVPNSARYEDMWSQHTAGGVCVRVYFRNRAIYKISMLVPREFWSRRM